MRTKPLVLTVLSVTAMFSATSLAADDMSVQVKTTQVRDKDSYLGKVLYELHFGDRVTVQKKETAWFLIQPVNLAAVKITPGVDGQPPVVTGYVNKSALTTKRIVLKADQGVQMSASADDVTLAGKGFNDDVEQSYRANHPTLVAAYTTLDHIENDPAYSPTPEDISAFRAAGGLNGGGM